MNLIEKGARVMTSGQVVEHPRVGRMSVRLLEAPVWYFGCWSRTRAGHVVYRPDGSSDWDLFAASEWRGKIDAGFLTDEAIAEEQGHGVFLRHSGWSIATFWDRTGDARPNSNSAFLVEGDWEPRDLMDRARVAFPSIVRRIEARGRIQVPWP